MIEQPNPLSLTRQCQLLGLSRAALYYRPVEDTVEELELLALIDRQNLRTPFYGSRRITAWLQSQGHMVNRKRVQTLDAIDGYRGYLSAPTHQQAGTGPPHLSLPAARSRHRARQSSVGCRYICYIPMAHGFLYLVAVMDWVRRYVLAWRLSNLLDSSFCIEALEDALSQGRPEIFNTDQVSQFTGDDFTEVLRVHEIAISMDGRGRFSDNIFVERLWRSLKYEDVYLKAYRGADEPRCSIAAYFEFYNDERSHQALGYRTPRQVFEKRCRL
jgi:putative transposase